MYNLSQTGGQNLKRESLLEVLKNWRAKKGKDEWSSLCKVSQGRKKREMKQTEKGWENKKLYKEVEIQGSGLFIFLVSFCFQGRQTGKLFSSLSLSLL